MSAIDHFIDFPLFQVPEFQFTREQYRGENKKKILILLPANEDKEVLQTFLAKVLAAVQLDLQTDILLLTISSGEQFHLGSVIQQEGIQTTLIFGIQPKRLGVHLAIQPYQPVSVGGLRLLFAHSLSEIHEERQQGGKQMAGALWRAMKALFLI